jgi:hypothetical protein
MSGIYFGSGSDIVPLSQDEVYSWTFVDVSLDKPELMWRAKNQGFEVFETEWGFDYNGDDGEQREVHLVEKSCYAVLSEFDLEEYEFVFVAGFIPYDIFESGTKHDYSKSGSGEFLKNFTNLQTVFVAKFMVPINDLDPELVKSYKVVTVSDSS